MTQENFKARIGELQRIRMAQYEEVEAPRASGNAMCAMKGCALRALARRNIARGEGRARTREARVREGGREVK